MIQQTPTEMLRDVLGTISEACQVMSDAAMELNIQRVKTQFDVLYRSMKVLGVIEKEIMKKGDVVHCADCAHCASCMVDESFYCDEFDMYFYAPDYRAETWFCADGIPREKGEDGMK